MRFCPPERIAAQRTDDFDCGSPQQTEWLRRYALIADRNGTSRVTVVRDLEAEDPACVVGFHALAIGQVAPADAPARLLKGGGAYPQPVIVLTRLGVDGSTQGTGLGKALVVDALRRTLSVAEHVGVRALLVHAQDETARAFYLHLAEFEMSPTDDLHLVLLLKDLRRALR